MFTYKDFGIKTAIKMNTNFRFLHENILRGNAKAICLERDMEYYKNFFYPSAISVTAD